MSSQPNGVAPNGGPATQPGSSGVSVSGSEQLILTDEHAEEVKISCSDPHSDFLSTCRQHGYEIDSTNGKR